jgi:AcrR family transcriptional regulator
MKRQVVSHAHIEEVRCRILTAARALCLKQGYKKTTIRQIVQTSGVLTGSIYYLYKNKAAIFQAMMLELFKECVQILDEDFYDASPALRYGLMCRIELKAVERSPLVRETYYEGYTQPAIFEKIVRHAAAVTREMFQARQPFFTAQDYYQRTLLIRGMMRSCIAQYYFAGGEADPVCAKLTLETALTLLGVQPVEREQVLSQLAAMDKEVCQLTERMLNRQKITGQQD